MSDAERLAYASASAYDRRGHQTRYRLAAGFCSPGDRVVDAACGTGYGAEILEARGPISDYLGVERDLAVLEVEPRPPERRFLEADLETWGGPAEPFDVAVVFETLEHLSDPSALVAWSQRARKYVLVSVPLVPTLHRNAFHRRDFRAWEIERLYAPLRRFAFFDQPDEGSGIWVFEQW